MEWEISDQVQSKLAVELVLGNSLQRSDRVITTWAFKVSKESFTHGDHEETKHGDVRFFVEVSVWELEIEKSSLTIEPSRENVHECFENLEYARAQTVMTDDETLTEIDIFAIQIRAVDIVR